VVVVDRSTVDVEPVRNLAGEPRDTVRLDGVEPVASRPSPVTPDQLAARGALSRVVLMAGALEAMSRLTIAYTAGRRQFGRPVARFQLVQEHLVRLAEDAALVGLAADAAVRAAAEGPATFEIAAAKALASRAATTATKAAHQAHGAMGMTREYPLHQLSRRLWSWREEHGDDRRWHGVVGALATATGADGLYPLVAGGSAG
jgi:acyl-CoA dehydrogenase